jgi:hypothetical protein
MTLRIDLVFAEARKNQPPIGNKVNHRRGDRGFGLPSGERLPAQSAGAGNPRLARQA